MINIYIEEGKRDELKEIKLDQLAFEIKTINLSRFRSDKLDLSLGHVFILEIVKKLTQKQLDLIQQLADIPFSYILIKTEDTQLNGIKENTNVLVIDCGPGQFSYFYQKAVTYVEEQLDNFEDIKSLYDKNYLYAFYSKDSKEFIIENGLFNYLQLDDE